MATIKDNAIVILRYMYKKEAVPGNHIVVADLKKAVKMSPEAFHSADNYLLSGGYLDGTSGGDDGFRTLTSIGIELVDAEGKTSSFWKRNKDQLLTNAIVGVITFVLGLISGLLLR